MELVLGVDYDADTADRANSADLFERALARSTRRVDLAYDLFDDAREGVVLSGQMLAKDFALACATSAI